MQIRALDHLVLTVTDLHRTIGWYETVLGMRTIEFLAGRWALSFGAQKLNLQVVGATDPYALHATPGSTDFCLLTDTPLAEVRAHLAALGVAIVTEGRRNGAQGPIDSVYVRDPDENLVEIANQLNS